MSAQGESSDNLVALPKQGATDDFNDEIGDEQFMEDLGKLKDLRSFLIEQAVQLKPGEDALSFGKLNLLQWRSGGRMPTADEWNALERLTQDLFRHLSDPLRRRFLYRRLPWWIPLMVGGLGCAAFLSLIACMILWGNSGYETIVPFYLFWLASLGAIGSMTFIGMNALSVQDDATFDMSSAKLLILRVLLGALFGVVLTLPFGLGSFTVLLKSLNGTAQSAEPQLTLNTLILLLPFVLGFSTSLVIMILNQCVESIQTLFGRKSAPAAAPPPAPLALPSPKT